MLSVGKHTFILRLILSACRGIIKETTIMQRKTAMERSTREFKGSSLLVFADDYVALDIETTGLYDDSEIIEIGAVHIKNGEPTEEFETLIRPTVRISPFITELTGITNADVADAPSAPEALADFSDFLGNSFIVGQNVNFDVNFLYDSMLLHLGMPLTNDFADTLRISRNLFPDLPDHKLSTLIRHFGISQEVAHRGLSDSLDAMKCYEHMRSYCNDNGLLVPCENGMRIQKQRIRKKKD